MVSHNGCKNNINNKYVKGHVVTPPYIPWRLLIWLLEYISTTNLQCYIFIVIGSVEERSSKISTLLTISGNC